MVRVKQGHLRPGLAGAGLWRLRRGPAAGILRGPFGGRTGVSLDVRPTSGAGFLLHLENSGNSPGSREDIFEKNKEFCKFTLFKLEKMVYNRME